MGNSTEMLLIFLFYVLFCTKADVIEKNFYMQSSNETLKVISELPSDSDGRSYIAALKIFIQYLTGNKKCVDFVNLKSFTREENKLPASVRVDIRYLTDQSDMLQQHYDHYLKEQKIKQPLEYDIDMNEMYLSMLTNETRWANQIYKLDLELLKEVYSSHQFPSWDKYMLDVDDVAKWMPDIELSNSCFEILSRNDPRRTGLQSCNLSPECLEMLDYGNNFGYTLSLKLLLLLLARLSQGCAVFSLLQDERIRHHLCKTAYRESEYIVDNSYKKLDLMAEHIAFCTLDGHAQFVRKTWISVFLDYQTQFGYFSAELEPEDAPNACLQHINAVVVGALSAAIRFVLENYHR